MKTPVTSKNATHKIRHSLSSIDKEALTAICAICGLTDVHRKTIRSNEKSYTGYVCATRSRQRSSDYRLAHPYTPHPRQPGSNTHLLSNVDDENKTAICSQCGPVEIVIYWTGGYIARCCKKASNQRAMLSEKKRREENQKFIADYKLSFGCKNCGYRESVKELQLHARGCDRRADHINKLLRLKQERLIQELKRFDVLCKNCHDAVHLDPVPSQKPRRQTIASSKKRRQHIPLPFMYYANL